MRGFRLHAIERVEAAAIKVVRTRSRQAGGIAREHLLSVANAIENADIRQNVIVLDFSVLERRLVVWVSIENGDLRRAGGAERVVAVNVEALIAAIVQLTREERRTQTDRQSERVIQEITPILDRWLAQDGVGDAITAAERDAIGVFDAVSIAEVRTEHVSWSAVRIDFANTAHLAVTAPIERVVEANAVRCVDIPNQRRLHRITLGRRRVGLEEQNPVQKVAVAVQVHACVDERGRRRRAFGPTERAAAVSQNVLERRIDRERKIFTQAETRLDADVSGIRRVGRQRPDIATAAGGVGHAVDRCLLVLAGRYVADIAVEANCVEGSDGITADEVVAVLVEVNRSAHEIAAAQLLIDTRVELRLLDAAEIAEEVIVFRVGDRRPGARSEWAKRAQIDEAEHPAKVVAAVSVLQDAAELFRRHAADIVHGAARSRGCWAVDFRRTQIDRRLRNQFRVELLVGINRVVAGVVQLRAVKLQRNAGAIETANVERAAGRTVGVVVGECHARNEVQRF